MGFFDRFRKDARANHSFDEKDRELSAARRRMNIEIENLKKEQELEELKMKHQLRMMELEDEMNEFAGDEGTMQGDGMTPEDRIAMKLIDKIGMPKTPATTPPVGAKVYTDEQLAASWSAVPAAHKALVGKCTDDNIKEYVTKQLLPDADADTLNRCVRIARSAS